jgi:L-2-hydroxyglutarate oxidase LhgO
MLRIFNGGKSLFEGSFEREAQLDLKNRKVGKLSVLERRHKVMKFLEKRRQRLKKHPVKREYSGRSKIANNKPRINGKFVKKLVLEDMLKL